MCDCFHLAFPNWHASATGDGRRLRGPEQDTEDDLVCEEPEILEGERPRPQGSSPVEEFPTTEKYGKQAEGDFCDSPNKSLKKSKKIGFGSLFDKRYAAKMNQTEDIQNEGSEMIVKTAKEVCTEGLVVSGGGKEGIFIKELKPESPASKHLPVKEGDQILSATVYFENVSYEDALQILEHAQPYKVEFCLKRKPAPTRTQKDAETMRPDGEEGEDEELGQPEMRGRRKTKKQHDRISWPKFPSFSKGRNFKRSHSTSEAEEQRKLEISPPTSDTESPLKSPLKSPDGKEKKKMHKMKLKMRMTGRRSKSMEESQESGEELTTDNMETLESQKIMDIAEEHSFQEPVADLVEIPKMLDETDNAKSTKTRNEYTLPALPVTQSLHKVELISLNNTLKTTDITVAFGEDGKERTERSELKVRIQGKDKSEIVTEGQLKTSEVGTSDLSTYNVVGSPNAAGEAAGHQVDSDREQIIEDILKDTQGQEEIEINLPKVDVSLDVSDVGVIRTSPRIGGEKQKKERNILETESYGIRTRGPLADIAISKTHFANTINTLEFTSSDDFTLEKKIKQDVSSAVTDTKKSSTPTPVTFQPKPKCVESIDSAPEIASSVVESDTSELTKIRESKFKLPKVDLSEIDHQESITIRQRDPTKAPLLKREDIEIPGMEDKRSKASFQAPKIKEQKIEKIIKISKADKRQIHGKVEEFSIEDVKEAVSKFPAFKLPERDITGVLVQREVTIMEMKTGMTPRHSPSKISSMSTEISCTLPEYNLDKENQTITKDEAIILPKIKLLNLDDETCTTENKTDQSKTKSAAEQPKASKMLARDDKISTLPDIKFKLPKREDIEIPGMEAIEQSVQQQKIKVSKEIDTQDQIEKDNIKDVLLPIQSADTDETERSKTKAARKGHDKKSKKAKVSMPSFGIMKPDIRFPDIGIELPKKVTLSRSDNDEVKEMKSLDESKQKMISPNEEHIATIQSAKETTFEQMLHSDVSTTVTQNVSQDMSANEGELTVTAPSMEKAEIRSKDTNTDVSPHKMKLPKFKMPKIGGKSMKGTAEASMKGDDTMQDNDILEVRLDSEKRTSETDAKVQSFETDKNWSVLKMPSIDVSLPKVKIPKTEVKSQQEESILSKPVTTTGIEIGKDHIPNEGSGPTKEKIGKVDIKVEAVEDARKESGFGLIKFGVSVPKEKTGESGLLEGTISSEMSGGKIEMESSELPLTEIKETESKTKKRKMSFPKFGFSKPDFKVSECDVSLPTVQGSLQESADVTGLESKTAEVEAGLKDSTDSSTKFRLPTIKFPKFGVSVSKATDAGTDIQMPYVSTEETIMDIKSPEAKLSGEPAAAPDVKSPQIILSVSKPDVEISLSDRKAETASINIPKVGDFNFEQKKEIKSSPERSFSKTEIKASVEVDGEVPAIEFSKPDIKAADVDISLPQVDFSIPEGNVQIKELNVNMNEAEQKDLTIVSSPVKFKLPSISLPKFGVKVSKEAKDIPGVDIDIEGNVDATELDVDSKTPEVEAELKDSTDSPTKFKLPTIKFPKFGVSFPKATEADFDSQTPGISKDKPTIDTKMPEVELSGELPSLPEIKSPNINLSLSKPEVDVLITKTDNSFCTDDVQRSNTEAGIEVSVSGMNVQAKEFDTEVKISSIKIDEDIPETKEKESEIRLKKRKISFPKFGFTKSETKIPETETNLQKEEIYVPDTEIKETEVMIPAPEVQLKTKSTTGSPSKFKLPSISLPKFDISISKTIDESTAKTDDAAKSEIKATSVAASEIKTNLEISKDMSAEGTEPSRLNIETTPVDSEIKTKDIDSGSQGIRFMMPKFEISFPKLKGPESRKGARTEDNTEKPDGILICDMEVEKMLVEGKANIPGVSKEIEQIEQPNVSSSEHRLSKRDIKAPEINVESVNIFLTEGEVDVKQLESNVKKQTEMLKDDTTTGGSPIKFKLPTLKLPKFGSSSSKVKPETTDLSGAVICSEDEEVFTSVEMPSGEIVIKVPEIDAGLPQVDTSKPVGELEIKEQKTNIIVSKVEVEQKDLTISAPIKFKLPSINFPKIGGRVTKEEKTMPVVDTDVKGPEVTYPETEIKIPDKDPSVDIKAPYLVTEAQSIRVDIKVEDADFEGQEGKLRLPKFGVILPKVKESDLSTAKTEVIAEANTEVKASEIDVSVPKTDVPILEGSVNIEETSLDIKAPKVESDQKDSTTFGSPTKFKLPSISLPKFGVKSQKKAVDIPAKDSELQTTVCATDTKSELPEVKLKVHPSNIEVQDVSTKGSTDMPEVGSKGLEVKIKKPSFSFPKFGFSKPDITTSGVDVSLPKTDASIAEAHVHVTEQTAEISIPEVETEQKDITIVGSPTKFQLPAINLPKFGLKTSKGTVTVPSAEKDIKGTEISVHKPDIKVSGQIPKVDIDITEKDIQIAEGKVILAPPDTDVSIEGKEDIPSVDSKGLDVKLKKPGFSLPKFGFSKPDIKVQEADAKQLHIDMSTPEGIMPVKERDAEHTDSEVVDKEEDSTTVSQAKFKLPSLNLPKFGIKYSKATTDFPTEEAEADIVGTEISFQETGEVQTIDKKIDMDIKEISADVDIKGKGPDMDALGSKFKLPKFGIGMPKVKETEGEVKETKSKTALISEEQLDVQQPKVAIQVTIDGKAGKPEVDSKGTDLKLTKFSKPNLELDVSLSKADMPKYDTSMGNVDVSEQSAKIKSPEKETDFTNIASPTRFKLPTINFPKFGIKTSKGTVDISTANVDIKGPEVSLPDENINITGDVLSVDMKGSAVTIKDASMEMNIKDEAVDKELQGSKIKLPKFGIALPKIKGPDIDQGPEVTLTVLLPEEQVNVQQGNVAVQDVTIDRKADKPEADSKGLDVKLPKLGFSKPDVKADVSLPKTDTDLSIGNVDVSGQSADFKSPEKEIDSTIIASPTRFKLPTINFPKFGIKTSKGTVDIPTANVDVREPEVNLPDENINISGEVPSVDVTGSGVTVEDVSMEMNIKGQAVDKELQGSKFKLPKFGIALPKIKGPDIDRGPEATLTVLLPEEQVNVQQPNVAIQDATIDGKADKPKVDSKGLDVKLPKFSKQDLKADVSLPKKDMDLSIGIVDVSGQSADFKSPEKEIDSTIIASPTRFKLPTINFPKFGIKTSKGTVDVPTANVDVREPKVSLPDENINVSGEVPSVDMKGPGVKAEDASIEINIKSEAVDKELQESKFKLPKFGIALPKIKGPDIDQGLEVTLTEPELTIPGDIDIEPDFSKESVKVDMKVKSAALEVQGSKLPQFGVSLQKLKSPQIDINVSETKDAEPSYIEVDDVVVEKPADVSDASSKGFNVKMKKPSFTFPKIGFSKSEAKAQGIHASKTTTDIPLSEGDSEIRENEKDIKSPEGEPEITSPQFSSPTKFKLPTIKLPKFGVSTTKADVDIKQATVSSVDNEVETSKVDLSDDFKGKITEMETTAVDANTKTKGTIQEGQDNKFKLPKFGISLPKVKGPEIEVSAKEEKTGTFEIGITEAEIKIPAYDVSFPRVDITLQEGSANIQTEAETELKDDTVVTGSPSKFKLPTFKMPKFGISAPKVSDTKAEVAELDATVTNIDLTIDKPKQVQESTAIHREVEIKGTAEQPPEAAVKKVDGDKGSPSKFKLPTIKMPKISISRTKSQDGEDDTNIKVNAPDIKTDPKDKNDLQGPEKSPKFTMPKLDDVLRGFDVEFNVPALEEMEAQKDKPSIKQDIEAGVKVEASPEHKDKAVQEKSKFKFKFPKLGFSQSSDESDKFVDAKVEETEEHAEAPTDQKTEDSKEQTKTEKGGWFKFSKFSSPTKTAKTNEKETPQPSEEEERTSVHDDVEKEPDKANKEPEKSLLSEIVEENISPTLSLRSSEAFADISSTQTTEQVGLSQASPTKVKVKYAEPTATVGVNEVQSNVVTSMARCELISMEPHQPEKVNIPFSSDMSSPSVDTLKQMSGEIHVITSNIQGIPDTQQAAILTNLDAHGIHTSPLQVTLGSDSVLTVEETRVQRGEHTLVERHVVKETLGDDKVTVLVTHRTRIFEGDSVEPISDETASSIRRLRDTVHTEKMKFFDSVAAIEEVNIKSSETSLRHMDSSTDENEGK